MNSLRLSVAFSVLDKYLTQILVIATTAVMARILTPAETGLFLVAQAVILLAEAFRDFGVGSYIIQERDLSREMLRASFTVNMLLSLTMGAAIFLGAGEIAAFYGEPELKGLLVVATIGFVIIPFGSTIIAVLRREMAFRTLAWMNVAAASINAAVTIVLGVAGFGAISFIWGAVVSNSCLALMAFAVKPQGWMFRPSLRQSRGLVSFGSVSVLVTVANMAYDLLPRLLLGRFLGLDAVGLFSRAMTVCQLPDRAIVSALQPVVLPAMAAHVRAGQDLKAAYLAGHRLMSGIQWPSLVMLALLADPVVRVVLGPQWGDVPPLVRVMAIATMALAPAFMTYPVLVAAGRLRDTLFASLISLPPSVAAILIAMPHGLGAVSLTLLFTCPFQMFVALVFIRRAIGLQWSELAAASGAGIAVALGTAVLPLLVVVLSPGGFALGWTQTALAVIGGAVGWLATVWLVDSPLKGELVRTWHWLSSAARVALGGLRTNRNAGRVGPNEP